MKFLVTGVAGMIGSHLSEIIIRDGHHIVGIDNLAVGSMDNIVDIAMNDNFEFHQVDIVSNSDALDNLIQDCDVVIHLAALKKVTELQESLPTLEVNVLSTLNILKLSLKYGKKMIFASTSDVYGVSEDIPFQEKNDVVIGSSTSKRWAYAVSKLYCEHLCIGYQKDKGLDVTILRFFGGFSEKSSFTWSGGHIPLFIDKLMKKEPIPIHGDGTQTRSMGHGSDLAYATYLAAVSKNASGEIINVGNNEELSVIDTVWLLAEIMEIEKDSIKIEFIPEKIVFGDYKDLKRRIPNLDKAKEILGYEPKVKLKDAIKMVIGSMKSNN
jgi:UDP-glucose 4-epimerase